MRYATQKIAFAYFGVAMALFALQVTDDGRVRVFRGVRYAAPPTGERRWRASQLAGLHEIPVVIRAFSDAERTRRPVGPSTTSSRPT